MAFHSLTILQELEENERCIFCNRNTIDEFQFGKVYRYGDVIVHYFCLLFSSHLQQNGADEEGILGFLTADIKKEVEKKSKTVCSYCYLPGATSVCRAKRCKIKCHFPCGIENDSLHTFYDQFSSYCSVHRRVQVPSYQFSSSDEIICVICQGDVEPKPSLCTIWASCCKTAWFHRDCVQRLSLSAGYFFKCPNCNSEDIFRREMLDCGIYIPDQDAAWETEPNSFGELHERHNTCDADKCLCPKGRSFSRLIGQWRLILCNTCGSQGIHKECGKASVSKRGQWTCCFCSEILSGISKSKKKRTPVAVDSMSSVTGLEKSIWSEQSGFQKKSQKGGCSLAKKSNFHNPKSFQNMRSAKKQTCVQHNLKRKIRRIRRVRCMIGETEVLIPASYKNKLKAFQIFLSSNTSIGDSVSIKH